MNWDYESVGVDTNYKQYFDVSGMTFKGQWKICLKNYQNCFY
jgi:hypothetical protein